MNQSENIDELAKALCEAQKESLFALKDATNPFFKSKYSTLSSVWDAARGPLTKNGLSVVQTMEVADDSRIIINTILMHTSGQWIGSRLAVKPVKDDPQGVGSVISYARRYGLQAMVGICPDDDDGEKGMSRNTPQQKPAPTQTPAPAPQTPTKSKKDLPPGERLLGMITAGYDDLLREAYLQVGEDAMATADELQVIKGVAKQREVLAAALEIMRKNAGADFQNETPGA